MLKAQLVPGKAQSVQIAAGQQPGYGVNRLLLWASARGFQPSQVNSRRVPVKGRSRLRRVT